MANGPEHQEKLKEQEQYWLDISKASCLFSICRTISAAFKRSFEGDRVVFGINRN
ncbi:hypothetical protein PO124_23630 [Bacillus licheniformis]|nr:hypothetical protein [Bacillus licheniformis]